LEVDGLKFKDLNKNGALDPYEDWRLSPEQRAEDLLSKMTPEEKAAQMVHITLVSPKETWFKDTNVGFALVYNYMAAGPKEAATKANQLQEWSEESRLGIPIILSMDSIIGASWIRGATIFPDEIGLAATRDPGLVKRLAEMQREEMLAVGIRMSLSPGADLATDPRWGRFEECFGEDADLASQMVVAAIEGLQGGLGLGPGSILPSVKHFPGSGPQTNGVDGSPLRFDENTLQIHLKPFRAAIAAGAGSIMPYGYSTVPFLGDDAATRPAHESRTVITGLLREKLGYRGLVQTDWGMKFVDSVLAGADIVGGAGPREVSRLAKGIPLEQIDDRVRRILIAKFQLGIFEDPYVDPALAEEVLGRADHKALALEAASRSLTLLKADNVPSLAGDMRVLVAGELAANRDALSSGWKCADNPGQSILDALREKAGLDRVAYVGNDVEAIPELARACDAAVVVVGEGPHTHQPDWGVNRLDVPENQMALVRALHGSGIPVISVVLMARPYVLTELVELSDAVLVAYRPGVTRGAAAIAAALFGESPITGRLPFQLPRSMGQVKAQREDLPKDIPDPLFDYGFGLQVASFGESRE